MPFRVRVHFVQGADGRYNLDFGKAAETKAKLNLKKVLKATGAKRCRGERLLVSYGPFFISSNRIYKQISNTSTCYQIAEYMPESEKIATAVLLLHRNPLLYDVWRLQPGKLKA